MTQKQSLKERNNQKKLYLDQFRAQQEILEQNSGGFEKIFPLNIEAAKIEYEKAKADPLLTSIQQQVYQQSYQALVRQQDRYMEFINAIHSEQNERAARFNLKLDEKNRREKEDLERKEKAKKEQRARERARLEAQKQLRKFQQMKQQEEQQFESVSEEQPKLPFVIERGEVNALLSKKSLQDSTSPTKDASAREMP